MHALAAVDLETRKRRSRFTNDPRRLAGVDMRSPHGRRFRDIVNGLVAEFGEADVTRLRELGGLKYSLEQVQAAVVAGDSRACEDLVRLSNLIARREAELWARAAAKAPKPPSLAEKLKAKADARA